MVGYFEERDFVLLFDIYLLADVRALMMLAVSVDKVHKYLLLFDDNMDYMAVKLI